MCKLWWEALPYTGRAYELAGELGEGSHHCGRCKGWLEVEICDDGGRLVTWTSSKTFHNRLNVNPAVSVVFRPKTIWIVLRSSINMWPAHEEHERLEFAAWLEARLQRAAAYTQRDTRKPRKRWWFWNRT